MAVRNLLYACVFSSILTLGSFSPTVYDLSFNCDQTISMSDSLLLQLQQSNWPMRNPCNVTLQAESAYHLNAHVSFKFRYVDLPSEDFSCKARVDVYDTNGNLLTDESGVCTETPFETYESSGDTVKVAFRNLGSTGQFGRFEILATTITYGPCDSSGEFSCDNGKCVNEDVTCDGFDNCGDDSDEIEGCFMTVPAIIGIVVGSVSFVCIVSVIALVCFRRRTYRRVVWEGTPALAQGTSVQSGPVLSGYNGYIPPKEVPPYMGPPPSYGAVTGNDTGATEKN